MLVCWNALRYLEVQETWKPKSEASDSLGGCGLKANQKARRGEWALQAYGWLRKDTRFGAGWWCRLGENLGAKAIQRNIILLWLVHVKWAPWLEAEAIGIGTHREWDTAQKMGKPENDLCQHLACCGFPWSPNSDYMLEWCLMKCVYGGVEVGVIQGRQRLQWR